MPIVDDPPRTHRRPAPAGISAGPDVGLVAQVAVVGGLAATVGVQAAGWTAAGAFALGTRALLGSGLRRARKRSLGPADVVTLGRAILVGGVVALAADSLTRPVPAAAALALTLVALPLDAVDGAVARRTGTVSTLGARFDMEVDAALLLALSVLLIHPIGPWVLAIGAMRYLFVVAGRLVPRLTIPLAPRRSRKAIAAMQGVVLVVALTGVLPSAATQVGVLLALLALCWSFGTDVRRLLRSAP